MLAGEDRADDIRRQYGEAEKPRRIGRDDALGFGNIVEGQALIREKTVPDCVGADNKTHKAGVGGSGLRPIVDDDPHLLAGTFEASRNGQRYHLAIGLGLGFLDPLGLFRFVKPPTDPILIQGEINAVRMDLDARDAGAQKRSEVFNPKGMITRS